MDIQTKDIVLVLLGFGFGIVGSMIANLAMGPVLQILIGYRIISVLDRLAPEWMKNEMFGGVWKQTWHVQSERYPPKNENLIEIRRFLNHFASSHISKTNAGRQIEYFAHGSIVDNRYVVGRWYDRVSGGYYGSFMLYISPTREEASGIWIGVSSEQRVKSGDWFWEKTN